MQAPKSPESTQQWEAPARSQRDLPEASWKLPRDFLLCYKGFLDRWISLQRKPGQAWRWPNGTKFDNRFPIRGGGKCAFLMDENWFGSSRCMKWRHWVCSKPDVYMMGKGCIVESKV
nr:C-type lectin domain family 2 member D-like [Caretta caretta]